MSNDFKVVVLGSGGVGKSALTVKFVSGKFVEKYDPTIEDFYRKQILVAGAPWTLEILDTAGTEQFSSMRDLYIKNGQGFILVYSLTSRQTFHDILGLRDNILRVKGAAFTGYSPGRLSSGRHRSDRGGIGLSGTVPLVLVGNKVDLARLGRREVESEDAEALAREWCCPHFETSARDNECVDDIFVEIVRQMALMRPRKRRFCTLL